MASEANLRTVLSLCDPAELAQVKRVAINDALFWVYENAWHHRPRHQPPQHQNQQQQHFAEGGQRPWQQYSSTGLATYSPFLPAPPLAAAAMTHTAIAASLLIDVLRLIHSRLPGLQELIFIPRDENPLYSGDSCLAEPSIVQGRMARQIREAMRAVFGGPDDGPWSWRIMTLSADPNPPVYEKQVLGWHVVDGGGGGGVDGAAWGRKDGCYGVRPTTRLGILQESVRRRFIEIEREMGIEVDKWAMK